MSTTINLGEISVDVIQKDIKNIHLSVYPPTGRVRISAPRRMELDTIRVFAVSKLGWIKREQKKLRDQERESPREYLERESHYLWGKRYLLRIVELDAAAKVELNHNTILLQVRPGSSVEKKRALLGAWYREGLKEAVPPLIAKWEPLIGVKVARFFVQRMKTKWGGCNHREGNIRLNLELAKKPPECLEYILVHEMVHFVERHHNDLFREHMDRFMPQWRMHREELNRAPLAHEEWRY